MIEPSRRTFIKTSIVSSLLIGFSNKVMARLGGQRQATPTEVEGPFYPVTPQSDMDFDLTQIQGRPGSAQGTVVMIQGQVLDRHHLAIENAVVEIWQANAAGRYRHLRDSSTAPLDPFFQGWARVVSGVDGLFKFKTILPGAYPASRGWVRPPHIHFKINKKRYPELTTQMYFPGQPLNQKDRLFRQKSPTEQKLMIAKRMPKTAIPTYHYDIVLEIVER